MSLPALMELAMRTLLLPSVLWRAFAYWAMIEAVTRDCLGIASSSSAFCLLNSFTFKGFMTSRSFSLSFSITTPPANSTPRSEMTSRRGNSTYEACGTG